MFRVKDLYVSFIIYIKLKIKDKFIYPIWRFLNRYIVYRTPMYNLNYDVTADCAPRVLVSYITSFFDGSGRIDIHTNCIESSVIVKYFLEHGFVVDLVHCQDRYWNKMSNKYDVIFGFGEPYKKACELNPNALKIIYLTESAPAVSSKREKERVDYYYERHGIITKLQRTNLYYTDKEICMSDFAVLIGNDYTKSGYKSLFSNNIYTLNPSGLFNRNFVLTEKNTKDECNFLWFGSGGAIHKGLDLLLDVFSHNKSLHLYICGLSQDEKWLMRPYKNCSNIHDCGFLFVQSNSFLDIMQKTAFVVLPSAAEGMATSVLTCMRHGMIPIVTRNTGITLFDVGGYLDSYNLNYVDSIIKSFANMNIKEINEGRKKIYQYSNNCFTIDKYKESLYKILDSIFTISGFRG